MTSVLIDDFISSFSKSGVRKPALTPLICSDGYAKLTLVTSLIQRRGWCLLAITVTDSCMREWMKSIGRRSSFVGNVTSGGRDSHLASSLQPVNRRSVVSFLITHFICGLSDRSAWLYFTCQCHNLLMRWQQSWFLFFFFTSVYKMGSNCGNFCTQFHLRCQLWLCGCYKVIHF